MFRRLPPAVAAFGGSVGLLAGLVLLLYWQTSPGVHAPSDSPLILYCAAGLKGPLDSIVRDYEAEYGQRVEMRFGGSQTILTNMELAQQGDLFLPGDDSYIRLARDKGLLAEVLPLAKMHAVLLVQEGNPKKIATWTDLVKPGVKIAQANPDAAACGMLTRARLRKDGLWDALAGQTKVFTGTVTEAANSVQVGATDAGIVWDSLKYFYPKLTMVRLPELEGVTASVELAVLKRCSRPTHALRFARYVAARDKGLRQFQQHGFDEVEKGDVWTELPELRLMGGAMLRPAVEETIKEFEQREGVRVSRDYNGCGILVGQMKAGKRTDLYFACDATFMHQVKDLFGAPTTVSHNQLVIAVPKGNPHQLTNLRSLSKPGLKVGVGHEQQCAMGAITKQAFDETGVYGEVRKNVVEYAVTGDMLINQLRARALDAVVAYQSNVTPYIGELEAIPVKGIPCASPTQPVAVAEETQYPQLARRLVQALESSISRQRFEELGFGWELKESP